MPFAFQVLRTLQETWIDDMDTLGNNLDAKLEVFHSVQRTCMELLKVIKQYHRRICFLSQEENELGRFLRSQGSQDKTRAGKMMQATGKALCFSSQQRLALRSSLSRLFHEVETFRYRAVSDTLLTVNRMEQSRTEYRGALLWMKDVSQELDPDTFKQMEKFRKVQSQVRHSKTSFDKLKNDVCQKVDLLGASRCNLLSHVLTTYQTTLLHYWEKTSHTMAAVHESFKGYQPYEFTMIKSLQDPMNKLLDQGEKKKGKKKMKENKISKKTPDMDDQLISLDDENLSEPSRPAAALKTHGKDILSGFEDVDLSGKENTAPQDLLIDSSQEHDGGDKDEMAFMNEILNTSPLEDEDFSKEWQAVFGEDISLSSANTSAAEEPFHDDPSGFLPSQLLDQNMNHLQASFADWAASSTQPAAPQSVEQSDGSNQNIITKTSVKETPKPAKDLSAWFSLFADLDPLSNPDAVGKTDKEHELLNA
ncbi:islet cell autoantigen 1-like isoform X1 [Acipenser oxyrinchus oxyrinchus]|uniref:Islet cell autoantigen 1-like isoform X1 n=1 Tax=Acipenser oxyrinchus oxyrinchus TaxID=40147 RepID=A0AAD8GET7_ACIOX|nr:islet cell autoantigen 1-like isoform X1 [Acipenser oxyrinchus oxyrinchus]